MVLVEQGREGTAKKISLKTKTNEKDIGENMTSGYGLSKEDSDKILKILKDNNIDIEPFERTLNEETNVWEPIHRDVRIVVSSYEDEIEEYQCYVMVD